MDVFECGLLVSCMITAALAVRARQETGKKTVSSAEFSRFQRGFLSVYYIAMTADWLQGPYVYALYSSYGFSKHNIAVLFIGGFGASMVFGTFAGVLSDRLGRKRSCMAYCFLYIVSCVTKHARDYNTLMLGRVTGGIATSLLFSAFESWLVCEHNARGFDTSLLSDTFSLMYFGNSLCAIVAGIVAQFAADGIPLTPSGYGYWHYGGYCTPFDLSLICLVVVLLIIAPRWSENFGEPADSKGNSKVGGGLYSQLMSSKIWLCGAVVSFFEGSMQPPPRRRPLSGRPPLPTRLADGRRYIFVFNWTPSFSGGDKSPPYGLIFASFMVACMGGSSLFAILSRHMSPDAVSRSRPRDRPTPLSSVLVRACTPCQVICRLTLVGAVALAVPMYSRSKEATLASFLVFEGCVGLYWPAIGTVKSRLVPEEVRATVYNLFRVPLNGVVVTVLLNNMDSATAFFFCSLMLLAAFLASLARTGHGPPTGRRSRGPTAAGIARPQSGAHGREPGQRVERAPPLEHRRAGADAQGQLVGKIERREPRVPLGSVGSAVCGSPEGKFTSACTSKILFRHAV